MTKQITPVGNLRQIASFQNRRKYFVDTLGRVFVSLKDTPTNHLSIHFRYYSTDKFFYELSSTILDDIDLTQTGQHFYQAFRDRMEQFLRANASPDKPVTRSFEPSIPTLIAQFNATKNYNETMQLYHDCTTAYKEPHEKIPDV